MFLQVKCYHMLLRMLEVAALYHDSNNALGEHCSQMLTGCSIVGGIPRDYQLLSAESNPLRLSADMGHVRPCRRLLAEVCSA